MSHRRTYAYVFPITRLPLDRILRDNKRIVAKFLPKPSMATRFGPGTTIVFYQSRGQGLLVGQARVKSAAMMTASQALAEHASSLFLTSIELESYLNQFPNRENKEMLVLELTSIATYSKPICWSGGMTMAGRFLDREQYRTLIEGSTQSR